MAYIWKFDNVEYKVLKSIQEDGYTRQLIEYESYGEKVSAFLLFPKILDNNPAILINHQHNREHHLEKSEVCSLAGNPLQAFGTELEKKDLLCWHQIQYALKIGVKIKLQRGSVFGNILIRCVIEF